MRYEPIIVCLFVAGCAHVSSTELLHTELPRQLSTVYEDANMRIELDHVIETPERAMYFPRDESRGVVRLYDRRSGSYLCSVHTDVWQAPFNPSVVILDRAYLLMVYAYDRSNPNEPYYEMRVHLITAGQGRLVLSHRYRFLEWPAADTPATRRYFRFYRTLSGNYHIMLHEAQEKVVGGDVSLTGYTWGVWDPHEQQFLIRNLRK